MNEFWNAIIRHGSTSHHITIASQHITSHHITSPMHHITSYHHCITSPLHHITSYHHCITSLLHHITSHHHCITPLHRHMTSRYSPLALFKRHCDDERDAPEPVPARMRAFLRVCSLLLCSRSRHHIIFYKPNHDLQCFLDL